MFEFGSEIPLAARFFIAFLVVLALIALTAWLVRRFGANRLGGAAARGRQPRLAVIDAASVDGRRRLVLIRRDNIEHLLMIGGPTDVVVEQNIVRAAAATAREPARGSAPGDALPRTVPLGDVGSWPLQPAAEAPPAPIAPPPAAPALRASRPVPAEDSWTAPEPLAPRPRPAPAPMPNVTADYPPRMATPDLGLPLNRPAPEPAREVPREPAVAETAPAQTDRNLAEMAQRLEAALRRPATPDLRAAVSDPLSAPLPPARAAEPLRATPRDSAPRPDAKPSAPSKTPFDNLEQEMANLLGRPAPKP